jgi:hypothetical protein
LPDIVEGFVYDNESNEKHNGEIVQLVGRVEDERLAEEQPAFFVRFRDSSVGIALANTLSPWFS